MSTKQSEYWKQFLTSKPTIKGSSHGTLRMGSESFTSQRLDTMSEQPTVVNRPNPDGNTIPTWTDFVNSCNENKWCKLYKTGVTAQDGEYWNCIINAEIVELFEYTHLVDRLYDMGPNDVIRMNISSPGGYISTATQICSAMHTCKGKVITNATGICASAGSLIWSEGHECQIGDYALFMWHMSSHGDFGCSLSIKDEADYQIAYVKDVLLQIALQRGFVTEEEIDRICTDPGYAKWISANEMRARVAEYNKRLNGGEEA